MNVIEFFRRNKPNTPQTPNPVNHANPSPQQEQAALDALTTLIDDYIENFNSVDYQNLTSQRPFYGINLAEFGANKTAIALWGGKTPTIRTDNPDLIDAFEILATNNRINLMFQANEKINFVYGGYILVMFKDINGDIKWKNAVPFQTQYKKIFYDLYSVSCIVQVGTGGQDSSYYLWIEYNTVSVKKTWLTTPNINDKVDDQINQQLNNLYNVENEYIHNLGFCPAMIIQNKPSPSLFGNSFSEFYPSTALINSYQHLYDKTIKLIYYELELNRTRTWFKLPASEWKKMTKNPRTTNHFLKSIGGGVFTNSNTNATDSTNLNKWMEIQVANPQLNVYFDALDKIKNNFLEAVGLSTEDDTNTQKSATEINFQASNDNTTLRMLRNFRAEQLKELVYKSFLWMGMDVKYTDFNIYLEENVGIDKYNALNDSITKINSNLSTRINEVMTLNNMTRKEAENYIKEVDNINLNDDSLNYNDDEQDDTQEQEQ